MTHDVPSDIDLATGWSRLVIKQVADSIGIARGVEPKSWAMFRVKGVPHVNVGKRTICSMERHSVELLVDNRTITSIAQDGGATVERDIDNTYRNLAMLRFPPASAEMILPIVRASHLAAIRTVAKMKTSQRNRHDESLRVQFEEVGQVSIRPPGYTDYLRQH